MPPIDFCHFPVSIIKRSEGRSAVAAAAYRSGTKLTNEWDGLTHDYTRKGDIVHAEIMLPAHAPPKFADRSTLWNSVEQIEKARDSQLAREIEAAKGEPMTETKQTSTTKTDRRPDCVTEIRMGNSVLTVSGFFKQGATDTAADKMMKVLEAEAATQKTAI